MTDGRKMSVVETTLWGLALGSCGIVMIVAGVSKKTPAMLLALAGMLICHFVLGLTPKKRPQEDD